MDISNQVAMITGAGAGIGRAAANMFAAAGARLVLLDIDPATEAVAAQAGGKAIFLRTDVGDSDAVRAAVERAVAEFGSIDILYNCAGGSGPGDGSILDIDIDQLTARMRVDLFGTLLCCKHVAPAMQKGGGGAIVNMTSVVSLMGVKDLDGYVSAKGAVSSLTRALALKLAPDKIRVNAIAPSFVLTERIAKRLQAGGLPDLEARHLLGYLRPEQIASAALFLASDAASGITGQILVVDAGVTIS